MPESVTKTRSPTPFLCAGVGEYISERISLYCHLSHCMEEYGSFLFVQKWCEHLNFTMNFRIKEEKVARVCPKQLPLFVGLEVICKFQ
jgi:hypothetical protein